MSRGKYANIRAEDRTRLISAFEDGRDWRELAEVLDIKRQTAQSIIRKFMRTGEREIRPRGGAQATKMDQEMIAALVRYVEEKTTYTLEEMRIRLQQEFPNKPRVCCQTISRALDGRLISLKDLRTIPAAWNSEDSKTMRRDYGNWMMGQGIQQPCLIFLDEFGFNVWTARTKGRSSVGARAVRITCNQRGNNLTLCLAISPQLGYVHHRTLESGLTKEYFSEILSEIDTIVDTPFTILFDNARAHNNPPELSHGHDIRNLPKYSPFLNPAEMAGSCIKAAMKRRMSDPAIQSELSDREASPNLTLHEIRLRILRREMTTAINEITQAKCQQWFNHTMSYMQRCINLGNIFD
ncbi:MAG: transposase, partial [Cyanobacteria bacterium J06553_1]